MPGYGHPVVVSGDDTFDAPASQLYMYSAPSANALWNDSTAGTLYAFVADDPNVNDYGDFPAANGAAGHFVAVPRQIATGKRADGTDVRAADFGYPAPPSGIPDGPQWVLEYWSHNVVRALQFIRIEDIAYDRTDSNIVYFADTGEPRAIPDGAGTAAPRRLGHPRAVSERAHLQDGARPERCAARAEPLGDLRLGSRSATTTRPPCISRTTSKRPRTASSSPRIPAGTTRAPPSATPRCGGSRCPPGRSSRSRRWTSRSGPISRLGSWESSGIIDASSAFGPGAFLIDVQAHGFELETAPSPYQGIT